jgi:hypothetical protein
MLDGKRKRRKPWLYQQAACCQVRDATERLDQGRRKKNWKRKTGG